jgi:hypothetical protein
MRSPVGGKVVCNRINSGLVNLGSRTVVLKAAAVPELPGAINLPIALNSSSCNLIRSGVG